MSPVLSCTHDEHIYIPRLFNMLSVRADSILRGFAQTGAQFNINKITADQTKYSYVVAALDEDTATRALDILTQPSPTRSEREAAAKILEEELGDSKPSELMDKMLARVTSGDSRSFLFRETFLRKLPPQVQALITQTEIKDLRQLAKTADVHF
uniref:DUF7041 domain-containing protein n=1 Tax=Octopus bimaculoides TaxID=37653 RepID=A0A0L8I5B1_OCTBM